MLKSISAIMLAAFIFINAGAQTHIPAPNNSRTVLEVNFPGILQSAGYEQLNQSKASGRLLDKLLQRPAKYDYVDDSTLHVQNHGIDFTRKAYMHTVNTDSSNYTLSLVPIADVKMFKDYVITTSGAIGSKEYAQGNIYKTDKKTLMYVNENYAIAIKSEASGTFFDDSVNAARYNIERPNYYSSVALDTTVADVDYDSEYDEVDSVVVIEAVPDEEYEEVDSTETESKIDLEKYLDVGEDEYADEEVDVDEYIEEEEEDEEGKYDYSAYSIAYAAYQSKLDSISYIWAEEYLQQLLTENNDTENWLRKLNNYTPPAQNNMLSYYEAGDMFSAYKQSFRAIFGMYGIPAFSGLATVPVYSDWTGYYLKMDNKDIVFDYAYHTSPENLNTLKKIYNKKLNRKLFKYINEDNDLGIITSYMSTYDYLKEFPGLMANFFNGKRNDISAAGLAAEFFSIAVDEKELSKLASGDFVFVANGMKEVEWETVKFTTDEENFEKKADTIMEMKKIPTLMGMFTTENKNTITKWMQYAVKKGWLVDNHNGIFSIPNDTDNKKYKPSYVKSIEKYYSANFFIHDGIVFFVTEKDDALKIKNGNYKGKVSSKEKKIMRNNYAYGNVKLPELIALLNEGNDDEDDKGIMEKMKMLQSFRFLSDKITNEKLGASYYLEIDDAYQGNALELLLEMAGIADKL